MKSPNCPDHENLVHELALGSLDDREALRAEGVRKGCVHCRRWWSENFDTTLMEVVDGEVAEAFSDFRAPVRRRRVWLAAAAAAVLAMVVGSTSMFWRNVGNQQAGPVPTHSSPAILSSWDFEDGSVASQASPAADAPTPGAELVGDPAVFTSDLESGDLSGWSSHS